MLLVLLGQVANPLILLKHSWLQNIAMTASTVATRTQASKMQSKQTRSCVMSMTDGGLRSTDIEARRHDLDFLRNGK